MITSTSSSQVKHVCALLAKSKYRKENKEYVVEGLRMVSEVPLSDLVKVYMSESFSDSQQKNPDVKLKNVMSDASKVEIVSDNVFEKMSDTKTPQGVLAVVRMKDYAISEIFDNDKTLIIGVENLQDPGNLGTIIRMSEAAGATGILISQSSVDVYNPKVIRSTMGSMFRVPFVYVDDFIGAIKELKSKDVTVYAAHLNGKNAYTDEDYTKASAFLIGNEGNGLTDEAANEANCLVKIPMAGQVESLNAAIACTVLSFEAARQRRI